MSGNLINKLIVKRDLSPQDRDFEERGRIKKTFAAFTDNFSKMVGLNLLTMVFALPIIGILFIWLPMYISKGLENFNLFNGLGIGFGAIDQTKEAILYVFNTRQKFVLCTLPGGFAILSIGMAGCFNVCRNYIWKVSDNKVFKNFFKGIKRHWYKFLVSFTYIGLVTTNFTYAVLEILKQTKAYGSANAGVWVWTILGGLLLLASLVYLMVINPMFVNYKFDKNAAKNFKAYIVNSSVLSMFSIVMAVLVIALLTLPLLLVFVKTFNYFMYVLILGFGVTLYVTINLGLGQYITDLYLGTLYMNQVKQAQKEEKKAQQQYNKNKKKKNNK